MLKEIKSVGIVKTKIADITLPAGFKLENGSVLKKLEVAYETYGELTPDADNVIMICHALSGDAHAAGRHNELDQKAGWWDVMIGPGKGINTDKFFVICSNVLGGCKGTTGPSSINPDTGQPYGTAFPEITIGDMIEAQKALLDHLGIKKIYGVIGGSAGGIQALEWCVKYPALIEKAVCIAAAESLSAQALSFDIIARNIIMADPSWQNGHYYGKDIPQKGLSLARMIGHITYLSRESMESKFGRERRGNMQKNMFGTDFEIESYLNHQGKSFVERFDANSFLYITSAMDSYSLRERGLSLEDIFKKCEAKFLLLSVSSDWLYPAEESKELAESLLRSEKKVTYCNLKSQYGHDSFLLENKDLTDLVRSFFKKKYPKDEFYKQDTEDQNDFAMIEKMIKPGSKILDLGCGDGSFLKKMLYEKSMTGHGIDKDFANIIECNYKNVPAFQVDLDEGLGMIPDNFYDYAVSSQTLAEVQKPHIVLSEMLRVARMAIVSFANYAVWKNRLKLGLRGMAPNLGSKKHKWHENPNNNIITLHDFIEYCIDNDIKITDAFCIPKSWISKIFVFFGFCNLGADTVIIKITKNSSKEDLSKQSCRN